MKKDKPDEMTLAKDKVKLEKPKKERTRKGPLKKDPPKQGRTSKNALNTEKPKKVKASKNAFGTERPKKERTSKETPDKGRVNEGRPAKDAANSDDARKVRVRETLSYIDHPKKKRLKRENFLDNPRGGRWKKAGILTTVFVLAILISSLVLNQGTSDITVGLSDPDLPRVAFEVRNQRVNALEGYVDEMDITAMRDTITPISDNGLLNMYLETGGQEITGIRYEVYSLNGEEVYLQNAVKELSEDQVTLELGNALPEGIQEAVLRVALRVGSDEEKEIFYYTDRKSVV